MDKLREEFEAWFEASAMPCEADWFRRDPLEPDEYANDSTHWSWVAYQAASASRMERERQLEEALRNYMAQFGQGLEAHGIPFGPAQQAADAEARAVLSKEQQ